jgi:hypothetical protein
MDFADEDYRRLYVRRTVTSKRLGWEGRAVRNEMLTEFDRSGVWEFGDDAAQDIADLVELPLEVVQVGLTRLLATKTWVMGEGKIVWPSYVPAQTCARSDRIRQHEARERRRDEALSKAKPAKLTSGVTERHDRHSESHGVTPPSLALPPSLPPERDPERAREGDPPEVPGLEVVAPIARLARFVPDDWAPKDQHRVRCQAARLPFDDTLKRFRQQEFHRAYSDWDRRFDLWIDDQKTNAETERFKSQSSPRSSGIRPVSDLDTTSAACAYRMTSEQGAFCGNHGLPMETALARCRGSPRFANLSTPEQEREMTVRLQLWRRTGAFPDPNEPLPRPKPKEVRA